MGVVYTGKFEDAFGDGSYKDCIHIQSKLSDFEYLV